MDKNNNREPVKTSRMKHKKPKTRIEIINTIMLAVLIMLIITVIIMFTTGSYVYIGGFGCKYYVSNGAHFIIDNCQYKTVKTYIGFPKVN